MTRIAVVAVVFALAALLGTAEGSADSTQNPQLVGTITADGVISLRDAQGNRVTKLDPGTYDIEVRDQADFHTFHLEGPGVDERTQVEFVGTVNWTVTFRDGSYVYHCDPHPSIRGAFVVGNPPTTTPPPQAVVTPKSKLVLTSGPSFVITLKTAAGKKVTRLKKGTYTITVRDRGAIHDARLIAPGFNRATTVPFVGRQTWKVKLAKVGTLRYRCDPHAVDGMRGSAKIVA
jgi:plastocyanin